ncbi:MAG: potassium channel protein [Deltaproteobacteria bacterium]|nr:potassium channel protein [Deltaproteobacteria bacterium]
MVNRTSHIIKVILVFLVIMAFGVAGLMIIEGWPFLDALYMVVITLSTIGYREVHELSTPGTIFLIGFIILGVGSFLYVVSTTAEFIVEGHLKGVLGRKKMTKKIHELKGHYIICGFGRVGQRVAQELKKTARSLS